ncbi:MAG: hypothetical protein N2644_10520 [Candidatus Sumerlaea chitinivorans]|nr:hypothetical protein [Candidatus Sumerlaea chitinivorans]
MEWCKNHPTRKAVTKCKQCLAPICAECRIFMSEGIFCSSECIEEFRQWRANILTMNPPRSRFSLKAQLKYFVVVLALLAFIWGVFYFWLGTFDIREIASKLWEQLWYLIRLTF